MRLKETRCPGCNTRMDAATDLDGYDPPCVGDYTVCIKCGHIMVFAEGMVPVSANPALIPDELKPQLLKVRALLKVWSPQWFARKN